MNCVPKTHQKERVILRLAAEVLEDTLLPVALHVVPVVDLTVANGVVEGVGL